MPCGDGLALVIRFSRMASATSGTVSGRDAGTTVGVVNLRRWHEQRRRRSRAATGHSRRHALRSPGNSELETGIEGIDEVLGRLAVDVTGHGVHSTSNQFSTARFRCGFAWADLEVGP